MYKKYIKRFLDICVSLILFLILIPLILMIYVIIKIDSPGPVIFKHKRSGKNGIPFYALKFRTMVDGADKIGPYFTSPQDNRVTKVGKYLRRFSLDEVMQLINVIKGDMSLIGPRPPAHKDILSDVEKRRLSVRPGITGLSQVNGRSLLDINRRAEYDIYYGENVNLVLDISIILKTVEIVLKGTGVNSSIKKEKSR